jgi:phosphatidylserine/phosphatidylglycerophosphate/cardiolipin synthase-like enzyme/uncharacterized membrane protein YdjX (TVP38/TMEM64 family)
MKSSTSINSTIAAPSGSTPLGVSDGVERGLFGEPILVEGDTCWRRARAERAAVLVDASEYFAALRASLLKARRSIFILGWELHSRTRIEGDTRPRDGAPRELGKLLKWVLKRRPQLEIRILLWNHPVVYAIHRELFPRSIFGRSQRDRVEIVLDSHLPVGASHHEKLVIVDDNVAFCGGIDLTVRRWDTTAHHPDEPRRRFRSRKTYTPTHDVHMIVDGAAAAALGERARERWAHASKNHCAPGEARGDAWPDHVTPDFTRVEVGIMRTIAALEERATDVREVERATVAALARAERFVYVENQYITSKIASDALSERMRAVPDLEAVVLTSQDPGGWLEAGVMGVGRQRFMAVFDDAGLASRIRFVSPAACAEGGRDTEKKPLPIHVHAKVLIVDDVFIRIGSSNLNNRSMGFDTECDLAIEAVNEDQRRAIAAVRDRLIAEHWGSKPSAVADAFLSDGSVLDGLDHLPSVPVYSTAPRTRRRHLTPWRRAARAPATRSVAPIAREPDTGVELVVQLGDPERAVSAAELAGLATGNARPFAKARFALGAVALLVVLACLAAAAFGIIDVGPSLTEGLRALDESPWRVPLVLAAFVVGSIFVVPILALIGATVFVLGPTLGFVCSAIGMLLAASTTFGMGRFVGREPLRRWLGTRLDAVEKRFEKRGIIAIALIRKVPIAPFSIVNMLIGAIGVRYRDFIIGTALGMIPGIAAFAFVSDRALHAWRDPTPQNVAITAGAIVLWISIVLLVQMLFNRRNES